MKNRLIVFWILFFVTVKISAQNEGRSAYDIRKMLIEITDDEISSYFDRIDSMWNNWYLGRMTPDTDYLSMNKYNFDINDVPIYADAIYERRMKYLNSPIELTYNQYVRRSIDLYVLDRRQQVERMLGLGYFYFPIFEEELHKRNLPLELKYLPIIESALNTHAVSRSGATGLWQFIYRTAKLYKLNITSYIDERRDPFKLTQVAVSYLEDLYTIYNDWLLVLAAYNCGPGNLNKAIRRSGYKTEFWDIYPFLPRETKGYVPNFIAATYVMNYHVEHNLYPKMLYIPPLTDTVLIGKHLSFEAISKVLDMEIEEIKEYNPQYIRNFIPQSTPQNLYTLRLPADKISKYFARKDLLYRYQDYLEEEAHNGSTVENRVDNSSTFKSQHTNTYTLVHYKVKAGDNLGYIAEWYECLAADIRRWNNMRSSFIHTGQVLKIYVSSDNTDHYRKIDNMSFEEKQKMTGNSAYATKSEEKSSASYSNVYYTIQNGDTLWDIAKKFPGVSATDIMQINNISCTRSLKPGQRIKISN